jgi:hypothetical protein
MTPDRQRTPARPGGRLYPCRHGADPDQLIAYEWHRARFIYSGDGRELARLLNHPVPKSRQRAFRAGRHTRWHDFAAGVRAGLIVAAGAALIGGLVWLIAALPQT